MTKRYEPELGQWCFGQPAGEFACPRFVEAGLRLLASEIERVEWNLTQKEYEAPTENNGGEYAIDGVFEMKAYWWGDGSAPPNFKCGDIEVRWYKWLGRGMSMNRPVDANEFFVAIDRCITAVQEKERVSLEDQS